jgi:hypothetical protein
MTRHKLRLVSLPGLFAVCRLDADASVPKWAQAGKFCSITRTAEELSVVCPQSLVPVGVRCERDWRAFGVAGTMDFSTIGVVASLATPLADAAISVFVVSTFDTDYLFVKADDIDRSLVALRAAGHEVE